jgi:1,4-alpha-glucan branching enzyme
VVLAQRIGLILAALLVGTASSARAEDTRVTFRYRPVAGTTTVTVAGTFNDWNPAANPMADVNGDGVWDVTLAIAPGRHLYKFVVDGETWFEDIHAEEFVDDGFGGMNSVMLVGEEPMTVGEPGESEGDATPVGTPVTFRFRPSMDSVNAVSLAGTFNGWDAAEHRLADEDGDGVWEITLHLSPGTVAYQFVVDGETWVTDPSAEHTEDDGFGGNNALLSVGDEPLATGP